MFDSPECHAASSSSTRPLVVVADPIATAGLDLLRARADVRFVPRASSETLELALAEAEALIVRSETRVTAQLIERAHRLRVIGRAGVGIDNIDVLAAERRDIRVLNTAGANAVAVAEHTLGLLFAVARRIAEADSSMKRGQWQRHLFVGTELAGKTLGLIGMGRVGTEVAQRAIGLKMSVLVHDPYVEDGRIAELGCRPTPLPALLENADVISLHVPLTPTTTRLLDAKALERMKPGPLF